MNIKAYSEKIFVHFPEVKSVLTAAETLEKARLKVQNLLKTKIITDLDHEGYTSGLEFSLQLSCVRAMRQFLSPRSIKLSKFDLLEVLWNIARGNYTSLPAGLSEAFFEDIYRILSGANGVTNVYKTKRDTVARNLKGRDAAIYRSNKLDEMALRVERAMAKYRSGLEEEVIANRARNRQRLLSKLNATEEEFNSYKWQLRNLIRNEQQLAEVVALTDEEVTAIRKAKKGRLPFGITPYYASLMDDKVDRKYDHAIRAQVIPPLSYVEEMLKHREKEKSSFDFMKEADTSPVDLITRRYPKIAIFKPYNTCSQICVYCQRNWEIDDAYVDYALATDEKIKKAIEWINNTPAVTEVLVTGGDPLIMTDSKIEEIIQAIANIKHVNRIRIGSRTFAALPQRITDELVDKISRFNEPGRREVVFVTHFEHAYEITPAAMEAVQKVKRRGMNVYNQTVFTIENSRRFENCHLRNNLRLIGVDPYYTFNAKGKNETQKYRVPMARLQQEVKEEARLFPGIVRTDEPVYNVPGLGKNYLRAEQNHLLLTILPDGRRVYEYHPWEKFSAHVESYIGTDIPIYDFLQDLEARGENAKDYQTIYYYF